MLRFDVKSGSSPSIAWLPPVALFLSLPGGMLVLHLAPALELVLPIISVPLLLGLCLLSVWLARPRPGQLTMVGTQLELTIDGKKSRAQVEDGVVFGSWSPFGEVVVVGSPRCHVSIGAYGPTPLMGMALRPMGTPDCVLGQSEFIALLAALNELRCWPMEQPSILWQPPQQHAAPWASGAQLHAPPSVWANAPPPRLPAPTRLAFTVRKTPGQRAMLWLLSLLLLEALFVGLVRALPGAREALLPLLAAPAVGFVVLGARLVVQSLSPLQGQLTLADGRLTLGVRGKEVFANEVRNMALQRARASTHSRGSATHYMVLELSFPNQRNLTIGAVTLEAPQAWGRHRWSLPAWLVSEHELQMLETALARASSQGAAGQRPWRRLG